MDKKTTLSLIIGFYTVIFAVAWGYYLSFDFTDCEESVLNKPLMVNNVTKQKIYENCLEDAENVRNGTLPDAFWGHLGVNIVIGISAVLVVRHALKQEEPDK